MKKLIINKIRCTKDLNKQKTIISTTFILTINKQRHALICIKLRSLIFVLNVFICLLYE